MLSQLSAVVPRARSARKSAKNVTIDALQVHRCPTICWAPMERRGNYAALGNDHIDREPRPEADALGLHSERFACRADRFSDRS